MVTFSGADAANAAAAVAKAVNTDPLTVIMAQFDNVDSVYAEYDGAIAASTPTNVLTSAGIGASPTACAAASAAASAASSVFLL